MCGAHTHTFDRSNSKGLFTNYSVAFLFQWRVKERLLKARSIHPWDEIPWSCLACGLLDLQKGMNTVCMEGFHLGAGAVYWIGRWRGEVTPICDRSLNESARLKSIYERSIEQNGLWYLREKPIQSISCGEILNYIKQELEIPQQFLKREIIWLSIHLNKISILNVLLMQCEIKRQHSLK